MNGKLMKLLCVTGLVAIVISSASVAVAQEEEPPAPTDQMDEASPEMQEMARSMKSMADMCQMMMQREAQLRPYWVTAACVVGALLAIALVLFIILEVQWIRFWNLRIETERKHLG
jgi:hypothetical protein